MAAEDSTQSQSSVSQESWLGLRISDQAVLITLSGVLTVLLLINWVRLTGYFLEPVQVQRGAEFDFKIDINTANWIEWTQMDGIGETMAHRIVEDRLQNGPFHSVSELTRVRGVGPSTLKRIERWLLPVDNKNDAPD